MSASMYGLVGTNKRTHRMLYWLMSTPDNGVAWLFHCELYPNSSSNTRAFLFRH